MQSCLFNGNVSRKPWSLLYHYLIVCAYFLRMKMQNKKAILRSFPLRHACFYYHFTRAGRKERTMNLSDMHDRIYVMVNACGRFTGSNLRISWNFCCATNVSFRSFARCQGFVVIVLFSKRFHKYCMTRWDELSSSIGCLLLNFSHIR